jgi:hypothetical protein
MTDVILNVINYLKRTIGDFKPKALEMKAGGDLQRTGSPASRHSGTHGSGADNRDPGIATLQEATKHFCINVVK